MLHEEMVNELNGIRLSKDRITSTLIYNFFENENEEKIIRALSFEAEVIYEGKKWSGNVYFSSKYRIITWGTDNSRVILDYNGKKFSPKTHTTEELIILNSVVEFRISKKSEFNIFLILLVDADNRLNEGRVYKPVEIPERLEVDKEYYNNTLLPDELYLEGIQVVKYNSMLDSEWEYSGDVKFLVGKDYFASFLVNGKLKDKIDGHVDIIDIKHVAGHRFMKGLNILFGEEFLNSTIFVYTDGIKSPVYSFQLNSLRELNKLGSWILKYTETVLNCNIEMYLTSKKQKTNSNTTGFFDDLDKYIEKFQRLYNGNPYGFSDKKIFEACLNDIFPNERNINLALSALYSDGIMGRLSASESDDVFVSKNSEILVSHYGIQDNLAFVAASLWNALRKL